MTRQTIALMLSALAATTAGACAASSTSALATLAARPNPSGAAPAASSAPIAELRFEAQPPLSRGGTWLCKWGEWAQCRERCEQSNALSCARLGLIFFRGETAARTGVAFEADLAKARGAFEKSCGLGYARACFVFGIFLAEGRGGSLDDAGAQRQFERACGAGYSPSCTRLADRAELKSDSVRAGVLFARACELGDSDACIEIVADKTSTDLRGALKGFRKVLRGSPTPSKEAGELLRCPEATIAVATRVDASGLGGPTMYCATPDGKHHGPYVEWASEEDSAEGAEHGVMRASGAYKWDRRQGQFKRWFEDGRLESEGEYNDDLQEGYWRIWSRSSAHEYGSYSKGKREGKWVESDRTSRFEGTYKDGKREGVWIEYLSGGDKFKESQYVDGLLDGTETRKWPSGQKCVETYVRGLLEGLSVCHHPNGRKMSEATFSNNRLVGRQSWDERGRPE